MLNKEIQTEFKSALEKEYSFFEHSSGGDYICVRPTWAYIESDDVGMFKLRTPKIPKEIYAQIVSLFKKVAQLYNTECLARVYWDMEKKEYFLNIPYQYAKLATVSPLDNTDVDIFTNILVLEVHSHGIAFDAFFSGIDDASEVTKYCTFGVFSFHEGINAREKSLFRVCSGAEHTFALDVEDLFEDVSFWEYDGEYVKKILSYDRIKF